MCARDPNAGARFQAKMRWKEKNQNFQDKATQFWNKETSFLTANQRATLGISRATGDIQAGAIRAQGMLRGASQVAATDYYGISKYKSKSLESGRSRTAGKSALTKYLSKQNMIDNQLRGTGGANMFRQQLGAQRQYAAVMASNRQTLGLPPTYGTPVAMPGKGSKTPQILGMAATLASVALPFAAPGLFAVGMKGGTLAAGAISKGAAYSAALGGLGTAFSQMDPGGYDW